MKMRSMLIAAVLLLPGSGFSASREIVELQRDVALLQEQLRTLQRSQDEKLTALSVLVQQTLDAANKANTSVAVIDNSFRQSLKEQEKSVAAPVAGVTTRLDQMSTDFQALRESVNDISARLSKLQQQIVDLNNAVKTIQTPAAPPPPGSGPTSSSPGTASGAPPVPAEILYQNAFRDKSANRLDLALQEFKDYLKYYGTTDLAANAQYYIGEIYFAQGDLDSAVQAFDTVLERYPDNNKTPDALYMKGTA